MGGPSLKDSTTAASAADSVEAVHAMHPDKPLAESSRGVVARPRAPRGGRGRGKSQARTASRHSMITRRRAQKL